MSLNDFDLALARSAAEAACLIVEDRIDDAMNRYSQ